jgi:hypothetical protein
VWHTLTLAIAMLLRDKSLRSNLGVLRADTILDRLTLAHQAESLARIYRKPSDDSSLANFTEKRKC